MHKYRASLDRTAEGGCPHTFSPTETLPKLLLDFAPEGAVRASRKGWRPVYIL